MTTVALALILNLHALIVEQSLTLNASAGSDSTTVYSFSSTKWKPIDGKSLVVETVRNHLPDVGAHFTFLQTPEVILPRARLARDGTVKPADMTFAWTTYRSTREVEGGPVRRYPDPTGRKKELVPQNTARCWRPSKDSVIGKAGQTLEARLSRGEQELFSCKAAIEKDREGTIVTRYHVRNSSPKDATFEWGPYTETLKAGQSREYTVKSGAFPKEADWNCSVSFAGDAGSVFKANAWVPK